ncbi:hypothetical protein OUZ56_027967 [Daphnia magna]|uniref:Uncharacterized protein n=1 Tax=Daphnia magna TaxID=35525 RepID=A0ABR0B2G4_9CRUS|nr:hypothetical protein OUZ56_027967 [Daphnia magna]
MPEFTPYVAINKHTAVIVLSSSTYSNLVLIFFSYFKNYCCGLAARSSRSTVRGTPPSSSVSQAREDSRVERSSRSTVRGTPPSSSVSQAREDSRVERCDPGSYRMSKRPKQQTVPFQTITRASASTAQATAGNIPIQASSPTRPSRILARLSPVTMATNDDLIQALTAFTQAAANDRAQQQQKHDDLLQALQTQRAENGISTRVTESDNCRTIIVDSIPKFEGRVDEDVRGFIDHIDRVAISEGWTDAHRLQVGIRRLVKTALLWHVQTGHMHGDWAILLKLVSATKFFRRVYHGAYGATRLVKIDAT